MGKFSRSKGARGERALANFLKVKFPEHADKIRRGLTQSSGAIEADVVGLPEFWLEAKKGKKPNMRQALQQAQGDVAKAIPVNTPAAVAVIMDDNQPWTVVMTFDEWCELARAYIEKYSG